MVAFFLIRGEGPPRENSNALHEQGAAKGLGRLTFQLDNTMLTVWAAYAARRRLRRKRSGSVWPAEVFA